MAIEIVDLAIKNGGSFHSFLYVYQRVTWLWVNDFVDIHPLYSRISTDSTFARAKHERMQQSPSREKVVMGHKPGTLGTLK